MKARYIINTVVTAWDEPPRARHQVALELSKNFNIVFVERNKFGLPRIKISYPKNNVVLVTPYFPIDYRIKYRTPYICQSYQIWLYKKLRRMFREISVINFDHTGQMIFNYFNDVIYYCNDYYIRGYYFSFIKRHLIESEKTVIRRSRFCIATSDFLLHYLIKHNNNVHLVKLGAPEVNFTSNITTKSNHLISVSLVGFIDSKRISVDLVKVIIANPYIKLYIFGPVKHEFRKKFKEAKNIHFKGIKTGNDLHTELLKTDVGIIPYFKKDNNPGRTPNKLWLYLALGLPVVVTDIDNIKNWKFEKGIIYRVNDNEDFVIKIKKAYNDNTNILINKRIKEAQNNSWEKRVNELLDIYNKYGNQ